MNILVETIDERLRNEARTFAANMRNELDKVFGWATTRVLITDVGENLPEITVWCKENCIGRWQVFNGIFFEFEEDMVLFKLRWL